MFNKLPKIMPDRVESLRIALVADNKELVRPMREGLELVGHSVVEADAAPLSRRREALEVFDQSRRFEAFIWNIEHPVDSLAFFARLARERYPDRLFVYTVDQSKIFQNGTIQRNQVDPLVRLRGIIEDSDHVIAALTMLTQRRARVYSADS